AYSQRQQRRSLDMRLPEGWELDERRAESLPHKVRPDRGQGERCSRVPELCRRDETSEYDTTGESGGVCEYARHPHPPDALDRAVAETARRRGRRHACRTVGLGARHCTLTATVSSTFCGVGCLLATSNVRQS